MSDKKNPFGGGNTASLYVPMSEDEQEVLSRLIEQGELEIAVDCIGPSGTIKGVVSSPQIRFGDLRISIPLNLTFSAPTVHIPIYTVGLSLQTQSKQVIFTEEHPALYGGLPILMGAGAQLNMIWDIAIQKMDSKLVKQIKPGATGLTSREGNTRYSPAKQKLLGIVRAGEAKARQATQDRLKEAQDASNALK